MGDKEGENPAALCAAVFLLSAKNRRGVFNPPSRAKVNVWERGVAELKPSLRRGVTLPTRG